MPAAGTPARPATRSAPRALIALTATVLLAAAALTAQAVAAVADLPSASPQADGMTPGQPFRDPPDANKPSGGHLTITLAASGTEFNLSGRKVWGQSYNGFFTAPTLRLTPGGSVTVTLVNKLPVSTNMHFHGLHVSPAGDSDDSFLCVEPGRTLSYQLHIPTGHPLGTFWYHSHSMGVSCPHSMSGMPDTSEPFTPGNVENQIFGGLSGAMIVGDDRTLLPPGLRHITAHTLVLKDIQLDATGHIIQNTATTTINSNAPTTRLVNGQLQPVLTLRPGATQLWRLVNAGADIFYQLHLDGHRFTVIGEDGRPAPRATTADTLLLPPAKRYDVLVTAGAHPTQTWLRTTAYSNGPQGDSYPDTPLVKVKIAGRPVVSPAALAAGTSLPSPIEDLSQAPVAQRRTVQLGEDSTGTTFSINGKQFSMDRSVFDTPAKVGTVEEWTILNTSGEVHPFHLHTNGFQVITVNDQPVANLNRQDIVPIPFQNNGVPGKVVVRIRFADYPGRWMFHCHIAAHEDNGMMSFINVVP